MNLNDDLIKEAIPQGQETPEEHSAMGGRSFISTENIRNVVRQGKSGYLIRVSLTSYRSLPLSCIEKIELNIDGVSVKPEDMRLILNGHSYKLDELGSLSYIWWFILDDADLFVASPQPLAAGEHRVEGQLVTVEPYVTGGRFSFFNTSKKYLTVAADY
jgi:methionine-rich copper-binding protein CopC